MSEVSETAFNWTDQQHYRWKPFIPQTSIVYKYDKENKKVEEYKIHSFAKGGKNWKGFRCAKQFARNGIRGYSLTKFYKTIQNTTLADLNMTKNKIPTELQAEHYNIFIQIRDEVSKQLNGKKKNKKSKQQETKQSEEDDEDSDYSETLPEAETIPPTTPFNKSKTTHKYSTRSTTNKNKKKNIQPSTPYEISSLNINTPIHSQKRLPLISSNSNNIGLLPVIAPNKNNNDIESSPSIPSNTNNIELLPLVSPNRNNNNIEPLPSIPHYNPLGFALLDGANVGNISFDPATTQVQISFAILQFLVNNQQTTQQQLTQTQQQLTQIQQQLTQLKEAQLQSTNQQTAQLKAAMHNNKNAMQNKIDLSLKKKK
eukprot:346344_1